LSSATRTILVTGFEPFGGEAVNASWEAARKLEGWRRGEYAAVARLLPCAYDASVKELIRAIETLRPQAVVMTGQAGRRGVVCVARFARNLDDAAGPDNLGVLRTRATILEGAPKRLKAAAPVEAIARAIREAGIPARVSINAGGFVCNHLYFGALQHLRDTSQATAAVFVHLPATPRQRPPAASTRRLASADAAKALKATAAVVIDVLVKAV
jgi:pyroglutamyl-peptidase